jgi:predicted metal-dependent peptidase
VLGETQGVCESLGIEVRAMVIDAALHDDLSIEDATELAHRLKGGGGSNFNPAFAKLFEDGFDGAVIAFTDGMIDVPPELPVNLKGVLWITDNNESPPCPWGDHLQVGTGLKDE